MIVPLPGMSSINEPTSPLLLRAPRGQDGGAQLRRWRSAQRPVGRSRGRRRRRPRRRRPTGAGGAREVEAGDRGLDVGQARVDQRDLEAAHRAQSRRLQRRAGPLVLDREVVQCLTAGWSAHPRGRRPGPRTRPAMTAEPSASASSSASIGLLMTHSPESASRPEKTETTTTGRSARRGSARSSRRTSKPLTPGIRTSSVIASNSSARSRSSAVAPSWTISHVTPKGSRRSAISRAVSGSSSITRTRRPRRASEDG